MSRDHPVRDNVIGGVLAGVILAVLGALLGILKPVLGAGLSAVKWLWALLSAPAPVPLGVSLLFLAFVAYVAHRVSRRSTLQAATSPFAAVKVRFDQAPSELVFDELEKAILRLIIAADGTPLTLQHIAVRLQKRNLLVSQALDSLLVKQVVAKFRNVLEGDQYALTRVGRDLMIQRGWLK